MEILVEFIFYAFIEIFAYVGAEIIAELLVDFGFKKRTGSTTDQSPPIWLKLLVSFAWGCAFGGISLLLLSGHFIGDPVLQLLNLIFVPILVGAIMMQLGKVKEIYGKQRQRLDHFGYAALFAFGVALVRYICI